MNKVILISLLPFIILSYTGFGGGRGHLFIQDPLTQGPGFLTFSIHSLYETKKIDTARYHFSDLLFALTYSPLDYLEISGSGGGVFKYHPWKDLTRGWHDWQVKGKAVFPLFKVFKPGLVLSYNFPRDNEDGLLLRKKGLAYSASLNLKFSDLYPALPNILLNYGKVKAEFNDRDTSILAYGGSVEFSAQKLLFFGEYFVEKDQKRLTPGLKFISPSFTFDLGLSFLLKDTTKYQLFLGFTYLTPFLRISPPTGRIIGKVLSASTNQPIPATISFPENPKLKPVKNDPVTGVYEVKRLPEGTLVVEVTSEGFFKDYRPLTVKKNEVLTQDFYLKPLKTVGSLSGRVFEANTGKPLKAQISFPNTDLPSLSSDSETGAFRLAEVPTGILGIEVEKESYFKHSLTVTIKEGEVTSLEIPLSPSAFASVVTGKVSDAKTGKHLAAELTFEGQTTTSVNTDPNTGIYRVELPVGTYTVLVKAKDYITQTQVVVVEREKTTEKNFSLVSVGMTITLKVLFDFNKATIKSESYRGLDEAAQILKDNPKIMVEIQGHTDNIGSDAYNQKLSERRAQAVANYFIAQHGIEMRRLRAVGYGETKPIASNDTEEGRALNRRVEFVVLQEE